MRWTAFLRAVNVGGRTVTMDRVKAALTKAGLDDVTTFLASGNVLFTSGRREAALRALIESSLEDALGFEVPTVLRTGPEIVDLAASPALAAAMNEVPMVAVGFLREAPSKAATKALTALATDVDRLVVDGRHLLWLCTVKQSDSKLTLVKVEKALGGVATFRGANTVARLAARLAANRDG